MLDALSFGGGGNLEGAHRVLLRAGVAAMFNVSNPDVAYPLSESEVVAAVEGAMESGNRGFILSVAGQLDGNNNLGCPID